MKYRWREEAEKEQRDAGYSALSCEETRDFISRFMPIYDEYLFKMYKKKGTSVIHSIPHRLEIALGYDRQPR